MHGGVWELDVRSGRMCCSDELLATLGLDRDRCPRDLQMALALVHPDDRRKARGGLEKVVADRTALRGEAVRMRGGAGDWREIQCWAVVETDPRSGEPTRIVGIVHDRTNAPSCAAGSHELARRLNDSVLEPLDVAVRHVKLAAVALASSPGTAGDLIDVSAVHLDRARDAVEDLMHLARRAGSDR
jgi:hypothetical protein